MIGEQDSRYWILGYPENKVGVSRKKKSVKRGVQLNTLYKCPKCDSVWEYYYKSSVYNRHLLKYKHIPSYGLERMTCKECKGECNG